MKKLINHLYVPAAQIGAAGIFFCCLSCGQDASAPHHKSNDELRAEAAAKAAKAAKRAEQQTSINWKRVAGHCRGCGTDLSMSDRDTKQAHREGWGCMEAAVRF